MASNSRSVVLELSDASLKGILNIPEGASGIVAFAHGSGSSRLSPRNQAVAEFLNRAGLGTLLFDLLTADEDEVDARTREYRFDISLISRRMSEAVGWLTEQSVTAALPLGLFGASTGAAAALVAAAENPDHVRAVVSRGGRPDLAGNALPRVQAATLLIVGGLDTTVIELNREAAAKLDCPHEVKIVPGASHLFEEPGKLELVQQAAADWFTDHLAGAHP
ncbi:dienelactone hydrolase family protein [Marinobacter zhanjiangensis]|uniref:Hydrolase n=1 Tax=Marinobacter zhanjiangensis TaxID=578215 RepID=A0ABQ3B2M3_9GAMM|nr:dienelactone hydrolase family protein [Marinobacter zhanjiangensis]GGY76828.1 hydrolase [Marinobacter zhanjiangensis]